MKPALRSLLLCTSAFLSGCAATPTQPIQADTKALLGHERIGYTTRADSPFHHVMVGNAAFGMVGLLASRLAQDDIAVPNHVADPSNAIAAALAKELATTRGTRVLDRPIPVSDDDPAHVAAAAKGSARFVVDVRTVGWGVSYIPAQPLHYTIGYASNAYLIDTQTGGIVAQAKCPTGTGGSENPPTYDELKNNNAALVKAVVSEMISVCTHRLALAMLGAEGSGEKLASTAIRIPMTAARQEPLRTPVDATPSSGTERWSGVMACGPLAVTQPGSGPYHVTFDMERDGSAVTVHRKSAHVVETLSGEVMGGQLKLEGTGSALDNPAIRWGFEMHGSFDTDAGTYTAKGYRIAHGKRTRDCALRMMRIQAAEKERRVPAAS